MKVNEGKISDEIGCVCVVGQVNEVFLATRDIFPCDSTRCEIDVVPSTRWTGFQHAPETSSSFSGTCASFCAQVLSCH